MIRDDVEKLIVELSHFKNETNFFYSVRDWDRDKQKYSSLSDVERAARIIYLNKTCYNGLYRVNNAGEFNSPFGSYRNPNIVNAPVLRAVSNYLNSAQIQLTSFDYADVLAAIPKKLSYISIRSTIQFPQLQILRDIPKAALIAPNKSD